MTRPVCDHCKNDISVGHGLEKQAELQLRGVWLCRDHLERAKTTHVLALSKYPIDGISAVFPVGAGT